MSAKFVKLPDGALFDIYSIASISKPDKDGSVYVRFHSGMVLDVLGENGRTLYNAVHEEWEMT
jgi:hypothetical protein